MSVGKSSSEQRRSVESSSSSSVNKTAPKPAAEAAKPTTEAAKKTPASTDTFKPTATPKGQTFQAAPTAPQPSSIFAAPKNYSFLNFNMPGVNPTGVKSLPTDKAKPSVQVNSSGLTVSDQPQAGQTRSFQAGAKGLTLSNTNQSGTNKSTESVNVSGKGVTASNTSDNGTTATTNSTTVGPQGVNVSTSSTTGPATTGGSIQISPDGIGATLTGALQVNKDIKVGFEASVNISNTSSVQSKDGFTTSTYEGNVSTKIGASGEAGVISASGSVEIGSKTSYTVRMSDADHAAVQAGTAQKPNPYDPATMPVGSSIQMKSTDFKGTEFEGSYRNIKLQTSVNESESASTLIEKTGQNTVRVTIGPSQAVENSFTLGVGIGPANVSIGKDKSLETSQMKTAEFDLSTPAGKDAYNKFMATGEMPAANGTGIANVATIQKMSYESTLRLGLELGPLKAEATGDYKSDLTMTTFADGSKRLERTVDHGDKIGLKFERTFGVDGKPDPTKDKYQMTYRPDSSEAPNARVFAEAYGATPEQAAQIEQQVANGQKVSLTVNLTGEQMQTNLRQMAEYRLIQAVGPDGGFPVTQNSPLMQLIDVNKAGGGDLSRAASELTKIGNELAAANASGNSAARQAALDKLNALIIPSETALEKIITWDKTPVPMAEDLVLLRSFQRPVGGSLEVKTG